jgi:hypothetical protein
LKTCQLVDVLLNWHITPLRLILKEQESLILHFMLIAQWGNFVPFIACNFGAGILSLAIATTGQSFSSDMPIAGAYYKAL